MPQVRLRVVKKEPGDPSDPHWGYTEYENPHHLSKRGGPKRNSWPAAKMELRRWIAGELDDVTAVYMVYGRGGLAERTWRRHAEELLGPPDGTEDAEVYLAEEWDRWDVPAWDVDPYSNPFQPILTIGEAATAAELGIFMTEAALRSAAMIRAKLPTLAREAVGWDYGDKWLKAWIYHHYPEALRAVVAALLEPRYEVRGMRVVQGKIRDSHSLANYAAVVATLTEEGP